jgi:hypothetical protein
MIHRNQGSGRHAVFGAKEQKNNPKNKKRKTYDESKIFNSSNVGSGGPAGAQRACAGVQDG